ncbi:MAG TPA: hypothetical protein DEB21_20095 [Rhodospirillaceae bacterium]|nr:hypothetical protein [Rhodospirillaceae bacterium]|tara:strand:- start:583 stop:1278 length:696 start_codon:yes stop_codon:yes gene_type:complete
MPADADHMLVRYIIDSEDGSREMFNLDISLPEVALTQPDPANLPEWTRLDYHKCQHCPLTKQTHPHCPVAALLVDYSQRVGRMVSYAQVDLTVEQGTTTTTAKVSAQEALRSVLGLVMATSGCPHMSFFRPLARYHVPLADMELTILRAMSFYLVGQYFGGKEKPDWDTSFDGLLAIYKNAQEVNKGMADRLRSAQVFTELNWLAALDTFAGMMPLTIERSLLKAKAYFLN